MTIKLHMIDDKVVIKSQQGDKSHILFTDPKFSLIGRINKFHYDGDKLIVDEMNIERLSVIPEMPSQ